MDNVLFNIKLVPHYYSFQVQVPRSASIANIKSEISKSCPGGPKAEGQSLIYDGRHLPDDQYIQDIWPVSNPPHDSRRRLAGRRLLISGTHRLEPSTPANHLFGRESVSMDD